MAFSPEYPDLAWMPPKSWTNANRSSVQLVVIHTTEGSEGPNSAEDGAAYDQRRTDGTSTHFFHDQDSTVQCVRTEDVAHAARHQGNLRGIQHELCGRAGQGSAGWADAASQGTLRKAAKQVARDCEKWGIPVRKLSVAQVAAGTKGLCGHVEITYAFPQDNGTHTDPGPTFPWPQFLGMVQAELEDDVALLDDKIAISQDTAVEIGKTAGDLVPASTLLQLAVIHAARSADDAAAAKAAVAALAKQAATGFTATQTAVANVDEEVWAKVPDPNISAAEKAALLRAVLGDDAAAVGALLAQV